MKIIFCFFSALILFSCFASAQDFPTYGIVSNEELAMKECAFDKEAPAVVLLDEAVSNYDDEYHLITWQHVRIKILKEKGFDYANIEIPFYRKDNLEIVDRIEAVVINSTDAGGTEITAVEKKSIYKKNENEFWGSMVFAFPKIKVGSIIEYKFRKYSEHYGFLDDWKFHNYLPVVKSAFSLYIPPRFEFTYKVEKLQEFPIIIKRDEGIAKVYFEMNNLPGLDNEPYMDARKDYIQQVTFQLSGVNSSITGFQKKNSTWAEVIEGFRSSSDFGSQLRKNLSGVSDFMDETKKLPTDEEKMKAVYNYVRTAMNWNGFNSKYAVDGIKDAWNKKTGTNGEINLILINLLKDAGLDAYPLLVSERWHGKVKNDYPFIDQFNTVYAYVLIGDKKFYLDASDKFTPASIIPKDILNTTALVVNRKNGGLITVTDNDMLFSEFVTVMATVDKNGNVTGDGHIKSDGYARIEKLAALKKNGEEKFVSFFLQSDEFKIDSFKILNREKDSLPAEQEFRFNGKLTASGGYLFFPLNNFFGFYKNPFLNQNRYSNINFGYKRKISTYTSVQLPKDFVPETLPKPVKMTTPDNDVIFSRTVEYDKEYNTVVCMYLIEFKKSLYTYEEYEVLYQVYKKIFGFLKEPLVLKKKP